MMTVRMDPASLARVRLAASPAYEIVLWLHLVAAARPHPVFGDLGADGRSALSHPDVALLAQVIDNHHAHGYMPDLLTPKPPPGAAGSALDSQLQRVRETPDEETVRQVTIDAFPDGGIPAAVRTAVESGTFARRAANGMHRFWRAVMADRWSGIRSVVDSDVAARIALM